MSRVAQLPLHVLESVATQAAHTLASAAHVFSTSDHAHANANLHESLPTWLLTGLNLQKLRADRNAAPSNIRQYLSKTGLWLHLLYRGGQPFGYVHGKRRRKDKHTVTNISVTREAMLIRKAIDHVDRVSTDEDAKAGIFECPKVGLAGIILFPKKRKDELRICLFRDPHAVSDSSPSELISGTELIQRLLELHVVKGPQYQIGE